MRSPGPKVVRIGTGNIDSQNPQPSRAVSIAIATEAHSWGWSEGKNAVKTLSRRTAVDLLKPMQGFENQEDAKDCLMMLRKDRNLTHFSMTKACDATKVSPKVGKSRVFSMVGYEVPELKGLHHKIPTLMHIQIHPNWVQGIEQGPVLQEFIESMYVLNSIVRSAKLLCDFVVVTGDGNISRKEAKTRKHSTPYTILNDFKIISRHLDFVAIPPNLRAVNLEILEKKQTKADHPWLVVDLARKR